MVWKMRVDLEGDREPEPRRWQRRASFASVLLLATLWIVGTAVLAAWLAGRISG